MTLWMYSAFGCLFNGMAKPVCDPNLAHLMGG